MDDLEGKGRAEGMAARGTAYEKSGSDDSTQNNASDTPREPARPNIADLPSYSRAGLQLIPLQRWDAKDTKGRPRGKSPRDTQWQIREYSNQEVIRTCERDGNNVGVRLGADVVVLDVDPRNFKDGVNSLDALVTDLGLDLDLCPHTITGSGGDHYWFRKPKDVAVRDSVEEYPGLEFKSHGRQVVAAGSVHPNGKHYTADNFSFNLREMPTIPDNLLELIRRPTGKQGAVREAGELNPERLAKTLEQLDPEDFRDHKKWLSLMMACHHATAGEGRQEFIDWSTQDPEFADHGWLIGRRWDSLHDKAPAGRPVTINTLYKFVQDAGGSIPPCPPEEDFDDEVTAAMMAQIDRPVPVVTRHQGTGAPKNTFQNCLTLVKHVEGILGLRFDEFTQRHVLTAEQLPWKHDIGREVTDDVIRVIRHFLIEQFKLETSKENVSEAVFTISRENPFHPIRDYLDGLKWDGVPRLDRLMPTYFGTEDNLYTRAVGAKLMIAGARRVRQPGCKFDTIVVLEGAQGTMKSSAVRALCPRPEWFTDAELKRVDSKDAVMLIEGAWIIEMGEMSVMSASEVETLKAFASRPVDRVRRPYDRLPVNILRQSVFIGTTNQKGYLRDQTGNRRFWPIATKEIDLDGIIKDRDQLWAEAAERERAGEAIVLSRDLWALAAEQQEHRVVEDPWQAILQEYVDGHGGGSTIAPLDRVRSAELLQRALGLEAGRQGQAHAKRLREVMEQRLGWKYDRSIRIDGKVGSGYTRLPPMDERA